MHPFMIMHPYRPDLEGKDLTLYKDSDGKYPFVAMVEKALLPDGGYVDYYWQWKDEQHRIIAKTSYVKRFPAWNWVVGTGVYTDDINREIQGITKKLFQIFGAVFVFIAAISLYISRQIFCIEKQKDYAEKLRKLEELRLKKLFELSQMGEGTIDTLSKFALEEAINLTRSEIGYLAFLSEDQSQLTMHSWSKQTMQECEIDDKILVYNVDDAGLWAEAARSGKVSVINDYKNFDKLPKKGFPKGHVKIYRLMSVPVFDGNKMVALTGVGNKKEDYNDSDVRQLQLMMDGMWKILQRKKAEIELKNSEERYRLLAENARDAIWVLQLSDLKFSYVSPAIQYLLGYTPSEFSTLAMKDFLKDASFKLVPKIISEELDREFGSGFDSSFLRTVELEMVKKDGNSIWVEITSRFLTNDKGEPDRILGISRDISERKRTNDALQHTTERLRESEAILKQNTELMREAGRIAKVGGWSADLENRKLAWSDEVAIIHDKETGFSLSLDDGSEFIAPEWRDKVVKNYRDCIQYGGSLDEEFEIITAKGRRRWVRATGEAVKDRSGKIIRIIGALQDISDRKEIEEEKKRLQEHLIQARKMEAIGILAGGIAHDFNNILSGLMGFTDLAMLEAQGNEKLKHYLNQVSYSSLRARDLVRHILTFSRKSDTKKLSITIIPVIKETLKFIRASLPANIEIRQDLRVEDANVFSDTTQIHQVLMNLFTNAGHAMKEKGGILEVTLDSVELDESQIGYFGKISPGNYLQLNISDTGCGIPEKIIDRIFEPFFTTKKREEGTGMGLATVYGILKEMGGGISVYSEQGVGTTFKILMPEQHQGEAQENRELILKTGQGNILIVDDEEAIIESTCELLSKLGYSVTGEINALKAVAAVQKNPGFYDLVLTDMTMPNMNGLDLAKQIRKINPDIPIVLCTGFSHGLTREKCKSVGIMDMVMKPMILGELSSTIDKAINKKSATHLSRDKL
ncbi:MAG: PAS domain S-box protein [Desulfamplus sp.]|nr:PAS domain S-box protein [Desulfamplus sp.]